jgi:hypothetical protein
VELIDTDRRKVVWRADFPAGVPLQLEWSADGERLLVVGRGSVREFDRNGNLLNEFPLAERLLPPRAANYAAFARRGHDYALIRPTAVGRDSEVVLFKGGGRPRRLFAGPGRLTDLAWSPNGRWLLVAWRSANQWLFLRPGGGQRIVAVSDIARQFNPGGEQLGGFPSVSGWCCPP